MLIKTSKADLVSVIIPVYNGEKYISTAVQSVLDQTYQNFELIIINDGSTDGTKEKLKVFRDNKKVKVVERENKGLVATLNEAVSWSDGSYIMRMDADDVSLPYRMEAQYDLLKKNDLDIVGSSIKTFGRVFSYTRKYHTDDKKLKFQLLFNSCFAHPTVFCKKALLSVNNYDPAFERIEDLELWTRLAVGNFRMGNCEGVHLLYRIHGKQVTSVHRRYIDSKRIQIAHRYWNSYFSTLAYSNVIEPLLRRDYACLSEEQIQDLNEFYLFLSHNFRSYSDIVDYQFLLCLLHNFYNPQNRINYIENTSLLKKGFLNLINSNKVLKRLPSQLYSKML